MNGTTLGILDLGSRTTSFYLKELNRVFKVKNGELKTCPFVLFYTNFDEINSLLPSVSNELDSVVQVYISKIEDSKIHHLLIPNITLHETIDRLKCTKTVLHPLNISVPKIKENNWNKVVLFGSLHTMQTDYIRNYFIEYDIEILIPTKEDMVFIDQVRKDVYAEKETPDLIKKYHSVTEKYLVNYPVIIACTELSIFKPNNKNLLDMAQLQIEEAVKTVLQSIH